MINLGNKQLNESSYLLSQIDNNNNNHPQNLIEISCVDIRVKDNNGTLLKNPKCTTFFPGLLSRNPLFNIQVGRRKSSPNYEFSLDLSPTPNHSGNISEAGADKNYVNHRFNFILIHKEIMQEIIINFSELIFFGANMNKELKASCWELFGV